MAVDVQAQQEAWSEPQVVSNQSRRCPVTYTTDPRPCPRAATVKVEIICVDGHCVIGWVCQFHATEPILDGWACGICAEDDRLSYAMLRPLGAAS